MKIPLFKIFWNENDIKAIEKIIRSGMSWCVGKEIEEFENALKDYLDAKYCLTFNSGGSAIHALMLAYGFGPSDEIIIPSFTFIATGYAPLYVNAKPIFADVELETFGLDPQDVLNKITNKTKAIIPIHYGGIPCKIGELKEIAEEKKVILIEDAAESFGAKYKNQFVGTFGDAAIFSFCHNKVFTTSEGGCVVTNNKRLYERLKLIRSYGRIVKGNYFTNSENLDYVAVGFNFRMSTLLATLGIAQLKKVSESIKLRRQHANYLNHHLKKIEAIEVPEVPSEDYFAVYQMYTIRVLEGKSRRDELMDFLKVKGITSRIYFDPIHKYTVFKSVLGDMKIVLPNTEKLASEVLTLPLYPTMTKRELDYIISSINEYFRSDS